METILVTGGGGFLGTAICERLCSRGAAVRSFSRNAHPHLDALGVTQIRGDIRDAAAVAAAARSVAAVIHTAALPGVWGDFQTYYDINTRGTQNVIAACREQQVRALVYTSSPSVVFRGGDMEGVDESVPYPKTYSAPYPHTKALAEQAVSAAAKTDLSAVILRPHLIWGPRDNHLVPRILARANRLRRIGKGNNLVDTVYIDNAAGAHILALDRLLADPGGLSGRIYFISQGEPIPLWEMIDKILAAGGKQPVTKRISPSFAHLAGGLMETAYRLFRIKTEPPLTRFVAKELATAHWFDISAARRDLGYRPAVTTEEGLARLKAWLTG